MTCLARFAAVGFQACMGFLLCGDNAVVLGQVLSFRLLFQDCFPPAGIFQAEMPTLNVVNE